MRRLALWAAASVLFVACQENEVMERDRHPINDLVFTTSWEETSGQGSTRTYINEKNQLRWNADDRVSIFAATTENRPYRFNGETGDNSGTFSPVENAAGTGSSLKKNYAVYPYREENAISSDGSMTVVLPATQHYVENSFGLEANTMTAVTRDAYDKFLPFKNVGGYLKIFLYGKDITVKSITLCGNNGEKLAGKATVKLDAEGLPSVTMTDEATDAITLDCGEGVTIGTTEETATPFWIVVPPTKFEKGFTITVTDTNGGTALRTTDTELEITRNIIKPMPRVFLIIISYEKSLESRLVDLYKATGGDHWKKNTNWCSRKPLSEWYGVKLDSIGQQLWSITLNLEDNNLVGKVDLHDLTSKDVRIYLKFKGNSLKSLDVSENDNYLWVDCTDNQLINIDISECPKLHILDCGNNQLKTLDVSECPELTNFHCDNNQLTALDISKCQELSWFDCRNNQLKVLDFMNCPELETLYCENNQLQALDVSECPKLRWLHCDNNQLKTLDVSECPELAYLYCDNNQLQTFSISNYPELETLRCDDNQLQSLNISNCPKLSSLGCSNNQLKVLDVSKFTELDHLYCGNNQLKTLDVSKCSKLNILSCSNNQLTALDVSSCSNLNRLMCDDNELRSLDVSNNDSLVCISCSNNQLTSLNIWPIINSLSVLRCGNNKISCQIPEEYAHIWYHYPDMSSWSYDIRYEYVYKPVAIEGESLLEKVIDHGVGWWFAGEPEKGYHRPD